VVAMRASLKSGDTLTETGQSSVGISNRPQRLHLKPDKSGT
jgi:hypothetical protein